MTDLMSLRELRWALRIPKDGFMRTCDVGVSRLIEKGERVRFTAKKLEVCVSSWYDVRSMCNAVPSPNCQVDFSALTPIEIGVTFEE